MLTSIFEGTTLYIIIGLVVVALIVFLVLIFKRQKNSKTNQASTNIDLESIYNLFGDNNIVSITKEQDRIKLVLKDVKLVNVEELNVMKLPAFLKGKELKVLFKGNSKQVYEFLKKRIEGN
ncbi:MAG: hypothetical protein RBQ97_03010 [Acholeplasma sp.]|nr:hypothetical protein [Acholeplasma sp.]